MSEATKDNLILLAKFERALYDLWNCEEYEDCYPEEERIDRSDAVTFLRAALMVALRK